MGAYRFSVYFQIQFGLMVSVIRGQLVISIPFVGIHFDFSKSAYGFLVFGYEF